MPTEQETAHILRTLLHQLASTFSDAQVARMIGTRPPFCGRVPHNIPPLAGIPRTSRNATFRRRPAVVHRSLKGVAAQRPDAVRTQCRTASIWNT